MLGNSAVARARSADNLGEVVPGSPRGSGREGLSLPATWVVHTGVDGVVSGTKVPVHRVRATLGLQRATSVCNRGTGPMMPSI